MTVDTRQLNDLVHHLTRGGSDSRNFIAVRKMTDMRGFVLNLRQVMRTSQILAEVVGVSRVAIDEIFIPPERQGLYSDENAALKFANGRLIQDVDPYLKIREDAKW